MGGGELFEGCNFYIFPSDGGNYSREAKGRLLFDEIQ